MTRLLIDDTGTAHMDPFDALSAWLDPEGLNEEFFHGDTESVLNRWSQDWDGEALTGNLFAAEGAAA